VTATIPSGHHAITLTSLLITLTDRS
jgi:hypothetical protein